MSKGIRGAGQFGLTSCPFILLVFCPLILLVFCPLILLGDIRGDASFRLLKKWTHFSVRVGSPKKLARVGARKF
jgi:hypothetical protein